MNPPDAVARAAVFHGAGQPLELAPLPLPELTGSDLLIEVIGCTLCGSDLHSHSGARTVAVPTILGHEILGRIAAFGPTAPHVDAAGGPLAVGDRVTWAIVASCGQCFYCQRGLPQKCQNGFKYGHEPLRDGELAGGLADYCRLAAGTAIFRVPDHLPDEVVCPANCATATVAAMLAAAGDVRNRVVLITGAGMLGLSACAMARWLGAAEVLACDVQAARRQRAGDFGATRVAAPDELEAVVDQATAGYGVDCALELSGAAEAFEAAWPRLRLGGKFVAAGSVFPSRPVPLLLEQLVRRNLLLQGIHNYTPVDLQRALEFLSSAGGEYPLAELVARWYPLSAVEAAFDEARTGTAPRVGVRPHVA